MYPEKYSLKWDSYSDHLKSMMRELLMNEDFSDVTLVTEDKKQIKGNISILSACSPVFKDMLKKDKNSSPIVYLRGIQHSEMESIIQFIYLGEATFYEERMDEILAVAKSLEIKELCNAEPESNYERKDSYPNVQDTSTQYVEEQTIIPASKQAKHERQLDLTGKYECDQCHKTCTGPSGLYNHKQSVHKGVKYACNQCDQQFTAQRSLNDHIQSKHEGVKYACDQCDYQAGYKKNLTVHIQSKHEGIKYACDQCDYQASQRCDLKVHIKSKHEGIYKLR